MPNREKGFQDAAEQLKALDRDAVASGSVVEDLLQLNHRVQAELVQVLLPGEQPHVVLVGAGGSAIVATAERVLVLKAGVRAGVPFGVRSKAFEYESVIGARLHLDARPAVFVIDAPMKIPYCRVYWADDRDDPWKARNAIPLEPPYERAEAALEALRGLLDAFRERTPALAAGTSAREERQMSEERQMMQALPGGDDPAGSEEERNVVAPLSRGRERCPHCRAVLRPGWRFCPGCGAPSESASAR
jgi:hypothetical protein